MNNDALNYRRESVGYVRPYAVYGVPGRFAADLKAIAALPEYKGPDPELPREDAAYWAARVSAAIRKLPEVQR